MSNFTRIVETQVKFWKFHMQDVILWNLWCFFSHKISSYYTVDCKPRISVSFLIKIRDGHIREISEPREGGGAGYFLVKSSYACQKIWIRLIWAWLSLYWHLRNSIRSPEGEGVLSSEGGSCACRKIRISGSGSIWPLRDTMRTPEGGGVLSSKGGRYACRKILACRPEHLSDTKICT